MDVICVLFLFVLPLRSSFVSVVFDFNVSPNDVAPESPIWLPVDLMRIEKCRLFMDAICVLFLLSSLSRLSSVSVVFDFSVSLIDVAPVSPMQLTVVFDENEKEWIVDGYRLCVVSFVFTTQIECCDRCV